MPRGFIHYRSPDGGQAGIGEGLRTRSVIEARQRINLFLAECTDNLGPRSARLQVFEPFPPPEPAAVVDDATRQLGPGERVPLSNEERVWEWKAAPGPDFAARVAAFVAFAVASERLPRIHVNAAVQRHDSPPSPQVELVLEHDFKLVGPDGQVLPGQDEALYLPGWGQSRLTLYLGRNRMWAVLHFPFEAPDAAFERCVANIEATGIELARKNFKLARLNQRGDGYVLRKM